MLLRRTVMPRAGLLIRVRGLHRSSPSAAVLRAVPTDQVGSLGNESTSRTLEQQFMIDRMLVSSSTQARMSYDPLPQLFEAPDLLTNPRLSSLVAPIDAGLLAPFYKDIDRDNAHLKFYAAGDEHDTQRSHYVRSFMLHCLPVKPGREPDLSYVINRTDTDSPLPWQGLADVLMGAFASVGVTEFRDFYTHVLPPDIGRHLPHQDQLQADTWKVNIRFSPSATELLVLDEEDRRWYALRFAAGGSGYVIDSALNTRYHAVRAGPAIQQSVLAVFHKQGSTLPMIHQAFARKTVGSPSVVGPLGGPFSDFALPPSSIGRPPANHAITAKMAAKNVKNCLSALRNAVRVVDPLMPLRPKKEQRLGRVRRAVIEQAIVTLPAEIQNDVRRAYDKFKSHQLAGFGAKLVTPAVRRSRIEIGKRLHRVVDDRLISIHGTVTVGDETFVFGEYDGTESTRLRFAWSRTGNAYRIGVASESGNDHARTLAVLARKLSLHRGLSIAPRSSGCLVYLDIVDGDTIGGKTAEALRSLGLTLRVVHVAGELDYKAKRTRELERVRIRFRGQKRPEGFPDSPRSAWNYFCQSSFAGSKERFDELSPQQRKVFDDKADADRLRHQQQLSEWQSANEDSQPQPRRQRSLSAWNYFVQDKRSPGTRLASLKPAFDRLNASERKLYEDKAEADQRQLEAQASQGHQNVPKRALSAFHFFLQEKHKEAKLVFNQLRPEEKKVYDDKAASDNQRYRQQVAAWRAAHPAAPAIVTAFEVFCAEWLQQHPDMQGPGVTRELKARWQALTRSARQAYEQRARTAEHGLVAQGSNVSASRSPHQAEAGARSDLETRAASQQEVDVWYGF